jgi:hypothetical protein
LETPTSLYVNVVRKNEKKQGASPVFSDNDKENALNFQVVGEQGLSLGSKIDDNTKINGFKKEQTDVCVKPAKELKHSNDEVILPAKPEDHLAQESAIDGGCGDSDRMKDTKPASLLHTNERINPSKDIVSGKNSSAEQMEISSQMKNVAMGLPSVDASGAVEVFEILSSDRLMNSSEEGLVKEIMEEICTTMRQRKEEAVEISIRRSLRKSTISDLSTEEILTELTTTDIILIDQNVVPLKMHSDDESVSTCASEHVHTEMYPQHLDEGLVLSIQTLEPSIEKESYKKSQMTFEQNTQLTTDVQLTVTNKLVYPDEPVSKEQFEDVKEKIEKPIASDLAKSLSDQPPNDKSVNKETNSTEVMKEKSSSQHSLGHLLSFRQTTQNIELGASLFLQSLYTVFNLISLFVVFCLDFTSIYCIYHPVY